MAEELEAVMAQFKEVKVLRAEVRYLSAARDAQRQDIASLKAQFRERVGSDAAHLLNVSPLDSRVEEAANALERARSEMKMAAPGDALAARWNATVSAARQPPGDDSDEDDD